MGLRISSLAAGCAISLLAASYGMAQPRLQPPGGNPPPQQPQQQQPAATPAAGMISAITPEITFRLMQDAGFKDVRFIDHQGQKHVGGKVDTTEVFAIHLACENGACPIVSFTVFLGQQQNLGLEYVNAFNSQHRFTKLYKNKDNTWTLDMDVHLAGGVTPEHVKQSAIIFTTLLKKLYEFKPQ